MNLADAIARHAVERPTAPAVVSYERTVDYATFDSAVWRAATWLRAQGIAPGTVVGLSLPDAVSTLVVSCALLRIGAVQTILSLDDPPAERAMLAEQFRIAVVIADSAWISADPCRLVVADTDWLEPDGTVPDPTLRGPGEWNPWMIVRSSGTTGGRPKGTHFTHQGYTISEARQPPTGLPPHEERYLALISLGLFYGLSSCVRTLIVGGAVILTGSPLAPGEIPDTVARFAVNRLALTAYHLDALLPDLPMDRCRCPGVLDVSVTGMLVPEGLRRAIRRRLSPNLYVRYGTNETRTLTVADPQTQDRFADTVGFPAPGLELEIVDGEDRPLPRGEIGLVRVRAEEFPSGYINNPEATAQAFRRGWFYPGDLGVLSPEGALFLKGRADDLINFDGLKIVPADIEGALLQHPAVAEAAAFPVDSRRHQQIPAAIVVLRQPATAEDLRDHCVRLLGNRAPSYVGIAGALPKNAMGKVLRRVLADAVAHKLGYRLD